MLAFACPDALADEEFDYDEEFEGAVSRDRPRNLEDCTAFAPWSWGSNAFQERAPSPLLPGPSALRVSPVAASGPITRTSKKSCATRCRTCATTLSRFRYSSCASIYVLLRDAVVQGVAKLRKGLEKVTAAHHGATLTAAVCNPSLSLSCAFSSISCAGKAAESTT